MKGFVLLAGLVALAFLTSCGKVDLKDLEGTYKGDLTIGDKSDETSVKVGDVTESTVTISLSALNFKNEFTVKENKSGVIKLVADSKADVESATATFTEKTQKLTLDLDYKKGGTVSFSGKKR